MPTNQKNNASGVSTCPESSDGLTKPASPVLREVDTGQQSLVHSVPETKLRPYFEIHRSDGAWGKAGVYLYQKEKADGQVPLPRRICSPLTITARIRDTDSEAWGRLLEWHDPDGVMKIWGMPDNLLVGEQSSVLAPLASGGLEIIQSHKRDVLNYIADTKPSQRAISVAKTGWAADGVYVSYDSVINDADDNRYIYQCATRSEPRMIKGTLESWQTNVAKLCIGNSRLMFAVSCAFSGPLLSPCGFAGGGFHFQGTSSIGKSLSMVLAASVIDRPEQAITTWRATDNGLEGVAARHNDGLLMLDELGQVDGHKAGAISYMLSNGKGKARANKDGSARRAAMWNLIFLSNGEIDLATHMVASGKRTMAGQEVRMLTIPADAGKGMGIFESLHDEDDSKQLAERVKSVALNNYGTAFKPFVHFVAQNWKSIKLRGQESVREFVTNYVPKGADGQVMRAAERFGLVAMSGELATTAGITGWQPGQATEAAANCFNAWLEHRGGMGSFEDSQIIKALLVTLTQNAARFESMETANFNEQTRVNDRLGFVSGGLYHIPVIGFREIMQGFDVTHAARVLQVKGIITHGIGAALPRLSLPGLGRKRCYTIDSENLPDID